MRYAAVLLILTSFTSAQVTLGATPPKPNDQIAGFKLPPGFEMQLVVADPDIGQPMNLNFDVQGRLWITHTVEYPFPAKGAGVEPRSRRFPGIGDHAPRDRLTVISGIDRNGKPAKITHFAGGLNIPIGQTPIADGNSAVVYGIPSIFLCKDNDGDGRSDSRSTLYSRFGNVDVHGNASSFTRWIDGWIYGCHGFHNTSKIRDGGGELTTLVSGNTYRFREDGSRFELYTRGQTNPFGMTFDPLGNLYSSDCHSKPIYALLRGASYPGIGARADKIGFGPEMIDHGHGSTGICGPAYYSAEQFPPDYRDNIFICNPVNGRIHRNKLDSTGATLYCRTQPDFVVTKDKWFRPVDLVVGPDGALYVADFCNLIIGHYEAPLDAPNRDRTHGRVWRIVWKGKGSRALSPTYDLTKLSIDELAKRLSDPNLLVRTLATNYLVDAHGRSAEAAVKRALQTTRNSHARAHALWVLERTVGLGDAAVVKYAADPDRLVRVHLMRILSERSKWSSACSKTALGGLSDPDAFVRRATADAVGRHPSTIFVQALLDAWRTARGRDTHLVHTARMSLREHFQSAEIVNKIDSRRFDADSIRKLVSIAAVADSDSAIAWLLENSLSKTLDSAALDQVAHQIARHGSPQQLARFAKRVPDLVKHDIDRELLTIVSIVRGREESGAKPDENPTIRTWVDQVADRVLTDALRDKMDKSRVERLDNLLALVGRFGLRKHAASLSSIALDRNRNESARIAALAGLEQMGEVASILDQMSKVLVDTTQSEAFRGRAARAIGKVDDPRVRTILVEMVTRSYSVLQKHAAVGLAESREGVARLVDAAERGKASARLLSLPEVSQRVLRNGSVMAKRQAEAMVSALPKIDEKVAKQVEHHRRAFAKRQHDPAHGKRIFLKHCSACHRIGSDGHIVGPQLDGIGVRGKDRILEDILDPNRNVDLAFRSTVIVKSDGKVTVGLRRPAVGDLVVVVDAEGKEIRIPKGDIEETRTSALSLMPTDIGSKLSERELQDLVAWLLTTRLPSSTHEDSEAHNE